MTARKLYNTNVRQVPDDDEEARISANNATFVMAYEFNEPGVGWQTGFAQTHDSDLRKASWECLPRPAFTSSFARYAHANPTLRYGRDGWWYLLSTRRTNSSSLGSGEKKEVSESQLNETLKTLILSSVDNIIDPAIELAIYVAKGNIKINKKALKKSVSKICPCLTFN